MIKKFNIAQINTSDRNVKASVEQIKQQTYMNNIENKKKINELIDESGTITADIDNLTTDISGLDSRLDTAEDDIDSLEARATALENVNIITIAKTTNQSIAPNQSPVSVQMTGVRHQVGNKLTFDSYGVTIGAGVTYVKVSGLCWVQATEGYKWLAIMRKRGTNNLTIGSAITPKNTLETWDSVAIPPALMSVEEGDYIYMTIAITGSANGSVEAGTYGQQSTYLTVEVVK